MGVPPHRHRRVHPPGEITETSAARLLDAEHEFEALNTCPHCRWSQKAPSNWKCRRWPPVVNVNRPGESMFPIVGETDYCGEFSQ